MGLIYRDGCKYYIRQAEPPMDFWAGVGVEVEIGGKIRRHAVEFDVRKVGTLSDLQLLEKGRPHLEEWVARRKSDLLSEERE